jgi:putative endonuclease
MAKESLLARCLAAYQDWRFGTIDLQAKLGVRGEQAAARFLRRKGLTIISHGESDRAGEVDLIATDRRRSEIIFVEVKTLASTKPGHPADRVDQNKQARITRAGLRYLHRNKLLGCVCRFDVVAVWWPSDCAAPTRIEHYPGAFEATDVNGFFS